MLYLEQLADFKCDETGFSSQKAILHLSGKCHENAPLICKINAMEGVLALLCAKCDRVVLELAIASQQDQKDKIVAEEVARQLREMLERTISFYSNNASVKRKSKADEDLLLGNAVLVMKRHQDTLQ